MREVLEKFDFPNTIKKLDEANLLYLVMEKFKNIDLHPHKVSNLEMGYIFEELIRKFNKALNENPGEHFTPREVIHLMVSLLLSQDREVLSQDYITRTVYDPYCGSGGMLTIAKERIQEINPNITVFLFGQEVNRETFAVCKSDLYMKSLDGRDAENLKFGSTLSNDQHADKQFDYLLANPPYGKEWKGDQTAVKAEADKVGSRFSARLPRISDGQLLFLQHMLSRMHSPEKGESMLLKRIANVRYGLGQPPAEIADGTCLIRATNIKSGFISDEGMLYVDPNEVPESRNAILSLGEIIVVRSGAYTGDSAIIPLKYAGAIAGYDMVLAIKKGVNSFFAWQILSPEVRDLQFGFHQLRAAQPHLNAEELRETIVVVPPIDEQKAIASFLDHETTKIDALIAKIRTGIEQLKEYRTALISSAVTGKIDVRDEVK